MPYTVAYIKLTYQPRTRISLSPLLSAQIPTSAYFPRSLLPSVMLQPSSQGRFSAASAPWPAGWVGFEKHRTSAPDFLSFHLLSPIFSQSVPGRGDAINPGMVVVAGGPEVPDVADVAEIAAAFSGAVNAVPVRARAVTKRAGREKDIANVLYCVVMVIVVVVVELMMGEERAFILLHSLSQHTVKAAVLARPGLCRGSGILPDTMKNQ